MAWRGRAMLVRGFAVGRVSFGTAVVGVRKSGRDLEMVLKF